MADDKRIPSQLPRGPRSLGALLPAITRPAFRKRAPAAAQVLADWEAVVGPALAAVTVPRRLNGGTLTLACSGPMALELQHHSDWVLARVNAYLGSRAAERLRLIQEAMPAPPPAPPRPAKPRPEPKLPGIPPGPLRDALSALGRAIPKPGSGRDA
jgi:hypothetical protein